MKPGFQAYFTLILAGKLAPNDRVQPQLAMARVRMAVRLYAAQLPEPDAGCMRWSGGSGLSDSVPPYVVNATHHLIGVDANTYELAVRRAEKFLKVRVPRQMCHDVSLLILRRRLDRFTKGCDD
jgi:hypothetical protein